MKNIIVLCFIVSLFLHSCGMNIPTTNKIVDKGFLDLSGWNFAEDGNVALNGEWEFYWNQLLFPADLSEIQGNPDIYMKVPGKWLQGDYKKKNISEYGCATYRLVIRIKPDQRLGIRLPLIWTASSLWINDTHILETGISGRTRETTSPYTKPQVVYFHADNEFLTLTLHVSNFDDVWGGISRGVILGSFLNIQKVKVYTVFFDAFFFGSIFIFALYHLLVLRKKENSNLLFGIFCLIIALRSLLTNEFFISDFFQGNLLPYWEMGKRIGYTLMYFSPPIFLLLLSNLYPEDFSIRIAYICFGIAALFTILLIIFPFRIFVYTMFAYQAIIIVAILYIFIKLIKKLIKKKESTVILLLTGYVVLALTVVHDILYTNNIIHTGEILHLGLVIFIFFYSIILAIRFSNVFYKVEALSCELQSYSKELEQKVKERTIELEESNKRKTNFFINLIHETKTPLTIIANYMDKDIKNRGMSEDMKIVKQNLDKLKRDMINFLDIEKINRGQIFYDHEQILDFSKAVNLKIILFKEIALRKKIEIRSDVEKAVSIEIDPYAIDRILNNLLDNAIRYTIEGGQIYVQLKRMEDSVCFLIKDTGIGISKEKQNTLFKPFYQLSHEKRNVQGIGIGLSIVKKIMDQVKGSIEVISEQEKGTTFTLTFKSPTADTRAASIHNNNYSQPIDTFFSAQLLEEFFDPLKDTVLIVEDNINMLAYIQLSLVKYYNVFYARNGAEALKKLKRSVLPQVIVSDVMMDEMDGYEFFETLKNNQRYRSIPFIFLTVKNTLNEKLDGLKRGAIDFIFKPFSIDELIAKIKAVIKNQQAQREFQISEIEGKLGKFLRKNFNKEEFTRLERICQAYSITQREKEVIILLSKGLEYKEISHKLNISINTLKPYIHKIYKKLQVQNKVELTNLINS